MDGEKKAGEISIAASAMGRKRWEGLSADERKAAMEKARAERQRKLSKARRREIASTAAKARWAKAGEAKPASPVGPARTRRRRKGGPGIP